MENSKKLFRSSAWSLRLRLLLWVGLVLLPPALFSILQGIESARRDISDSHLQLVSTARAVAAPEENILVSARDIALALSRLPAIRDGTADCSPDLASAMQAIPFFSNIVRVDATGRIVCGGLANSIGIDLSKLPVWPAMSTQQHFVVMGALSSLVTHRPVVLGLLPLHDSTGRFLGTVNVAIDASWLSDVLKSSRLPAGSVMAIVDRSGTMVAATNRDVARAIFAHLTYDNDRSSLRTARDKSGKSWTYATAALLGPSVYVAFAMPDTKLFGDTYRHATIDIALPFAMILLTWAAIWIVTDRQLTRWIIYLRRVSAAYRSGHYALRPKLDSAPSELRSLGDALAEMAGAIQERDRSLREAVAQKTLLIKEIHHRVKNNLQVVMSLLSLQSKRLKDPAAQEALRDTRARINALALVHRILYEIDDRNTVDVKSLLEQLAEQMSDGFGADSRNVRVVADIMAREIPSDMAVTVSLFAVEAITNAFKHAFPENRTGTIRVALEPAAGNALRLIVEDDGIGFADTGTESSIGAQLIKTFGQRIGGVTTIRSNAGSGVSVELVFPDPACAKHEPEDAAQM